MVTYTLSRWPYFRPVTRTVECCRTQPWFTTSAGGGGGYGWSFGVAEAAAEVDTRTPATIAIIVTSAAKTAAARERLINFSPVQDR